MSEIHVPRELQRFIMALVLLGGFFASFTYVFYVTKDVEVAKTVLTILAGAISSVVAFFFGAKAAEEAAA